MKVHFLPAGQERRNNKLVEKLRYLGYVLFVLFMATLALGARLYVWPPVIQSGPQIIGDDGRTLYSDAVVLSPDLVLAAAKITDEAKFVALGERRGARPIGSMSLPDGTELTLLRLDTPTTVPPVAVVVVELGDPLVAEASGQVWHGTVRAKGTDGYSIEPDFNLNPGTAVFRDSDRTSLVGFGIRAHSGYVVFAARDVMNHFARLNLVR